MHRILFADDDAGMRLLMQRMLARDFQVAVAAGGEEAMEILRASAEPFAVVMADMGMARGNGLQLLTAVREHAPQTMRILLSGDHRLQSDQEVTQIELFKLLLKPIDVPSVMQAVKAGVEAFSIGRG